MLNKITFSDRCIGAFLALFFAVPTVFFSWLVFNYNGMWLDLFISTDILKYSVIASLLIGFAFPNVLPKLLGAIWNFLYKNLNWWAD